MKSKFTGLPFNRLWCSAVAQDVRLAVFGRDVYTDVLITQKLGIKPLLVAAVNADFHNDWFLYISVPEISLNELKIGLPLDEVLDGRGKSAKSF